MRAVDVMDDAALFGDLYDPRLAAIPQTTYQESKNYAMHSSGSRYFGFDQKLIDPALFRKREYLLEYLRWIRCFLQDYESIESSEFSPEVWKFIKELERLCYVSDKVRGNYQKAIGEIYLALREYRQESCLKQLLDEFEKYRDMQKKYREC